MPPISERHSIRPANCGFIGTYQGYQGFRRRFQAASRFRFLGGHRDTLGKQFDYIITDWRLSSEQEETLLHIQFDNPDVQVHPFSDDVLTKYPIPEHIVIHVGTVACMWCGEEVGRSVIESHEAVCGA